MADRRMFDVQTMGPKVKQLTGVFTVAGTADPTTATGCSRGVTATRASAGKYKLTWADSYKRLVGFNVGITNAVTTTAAYKKIPRGGAIAFSSNYVEVLLLSAGVSLTNPSTGTAIYWSLTFEDGNV